MYKKFPETVNGFLKWDNKERKTPLKYIFQNNPTAILKSNLSFI